MSGDANAPEGGAVSKVAMPVLYVAVAGFMLQLFALFMIVVLIASFLVGIVGGTITAAAATCFVGPGATRGPLSNVENPSKDEVAASIYAQTKGFGYGDIAAVLAIGEAFAEKGLTAGYGSDNTTSRGYYQQFTHWVPESLRWSGKPACNEGPCAQYNESNAWGNNGWAVFDPRMSPAQSTNLYILGSAQYKFGSGIGGMEDATLPDQEYLMVNGIRNINQVDWFRLIRISRYIQAYPESATASHLRNMQAAFPYYERIVSGEISVPPFVAPLPEMSAAAHTERTQQVFASGGSSSTVLANRPSSSAPATARLVETTMMGDSHMVGLMSSVGADQTGADKKYSYSQVNGQAGLQMGPYYVYALEGISLSQVVNGQGSVSGSSGSTNVNKWREALSNGPSRVVVNLGTNDRGAANLPENIAKFMSMAGTQRQVMWVMPYYKNRPEERRALESALRDAAEVFPNLSLIETGSLDLISPDGWHTNTQGYQAVWSAVQSALASNPNGMAVADNCNTGFGVAPTGDLQRRALEWAKSIADNPRARYPYSIAEAAATSATDLSGLVWDCSNLTTGAYYFASEGQIRIPDLSGAQLYDTVGSIQVVPWSEAQPGDIFFQYTGGAGGSDSSLGHVGMLWEKNESNPSESLVLHACSSFDVCGEGAATGIGVQLIGSNRNLYVPNNPATANDSRPRGGNSWTRDPGQAWYGRVIPPSANPLDA